MLLGLWNHARRNAIAYLALFVALGGTAFAAAPFLRGNGNTAVNSFDLPATPNPSPNPDPSEENDWRTLLSVPGVVDLEVACARYTGFDNRVYESARLVNRSNRAIVYRLDINGQTQAIKPGRTSFVLMHDTDEIGSDIIVDDPGGSRVVTINFAGAPSFDSAGVPTDPQGCRFFAEYVSQTTSG